MKNYTLKTILGVATAFFTLNSNAQCPEIICPSDITVDNDAGQCGAVVNFATPVGTDPCSSVSQSFVYTGASETFTVPSGVTMLTIECTGARGGNGNQSSSPGGFGAYAAGDVSVTPGESLTIIVGGKGGDGVGSLDGGSGGGGSFVIRQSGNTPLVIAGGGGGGSYTSSASGFDASTSTTGGAGGYTATPPGNGGFSDNTGGGGTGGGGGGWNANGYSNNWAGGGGMQGGPGGIVMYTGTGADGGFGGGGASYHGGGGGGGYSGGGGGSYSIGGGGGASYNIGTNQVMTSSVGTGNGEITLSYSGGSTTTTQTAGLASGSLFPVGTTTNTFEVDDGNGNIETCSFDVVVEDVELPVPDATTLPTLVAECIINSLDQATATDNCDGVIYGTHNMTYPITSDTIMTWTFEDVAGNVTTQTQEIILSGLNVNVSVNDPMLVANNTDTGITYQWINCETGASIEGATGQSFIPESNGSYAVVLTLGNCINVSQCYTVSTVSLNEHSIEGLELYPNPNDGLFTVNSGTTVNHYTVVDGSGRLIQEGTPKSTSFEVSLKAYDAGMYYLHVNDEVLKVVVR